MSHVLGIGLLEFFGTVLQYLLCCQGHALLRSLQLFGKLLTLLRHLRFEQCTLVGRLPLILLTLFLQPAVKRLGLTINLLSHQVNLGLPLTGLHLEAGILATEIKIDGNGSEKQSEEKTDRNHHHDTTKIY